MPVFVILFMTAVWAHASAAARHSQYPHRLITALVFASRGTGAYVEGVRRSRAWPTVLDAALGGSDTRYERSLLADGKRGAEPRNGEEDHAGP